MFGKELWLECLLSKHEVMGSSQTKDIGDVRKSIQSVSHSNKFLARIDHKLFLPGFSINFCEF